MVQKRRIAITTAIGILTGLYCAGSLFVAAPPGIIPEPWFVAMIFYGRLLQGFAIGFADRIPPPSPGNQGCGAWCPVQPPALHCSLLCPQLFRCRDAFCLWYHLWRACRRDSELGNATKAREAGMNICTIRGHLDKHRDHGCINIVRTRA
jgi:hypothetical protein